MRTLLPAETLAARVRELGAEIAEHYRSRDPDLLVVPVLKGSFVFAADLVRAIDLPLTVDFLAVRSYEGTRSSGRVETLLDLSEPVEGRDVLVVEDIVDTGLTLRSILTGLADRGAASVRVATLLHKPSRTQVEVALDYVGFTIEDRFVVGYGLDLDGRYRNHPDLVTLEDDP
ncbi:MAG: hypoxanthine phosphoribosyltransferase [Sandaracinaceae bacterium]